VRAAAEKTLDARILADATGVVGNRAYYFSSLDYAGRNADVLAIAVEELNKVDLWAGANKGELATELSALWGIPKPVVDVSVGRSAYGTGPITQAILAEQQKIADTFFELKLIPKKISVLEAAPGLRL
jgi:sulfonate transport system substrate-binding protein